MNVPTAQVASGWLVVRTSMEHWWKGGTARGKASTLPGVLVRLKSKSPDIESALGMPSNSLDVD